MPIALSPLQERAVRAVASLLDELRPAQVLPTETVLMLGCQVVTPVPWDGSNKDDRYPWIEICIPHRSLGGLGIHICVAEEKPAEVGWWVVWNAHDELMVECFPEAKLPLVSPGMAIAWGRFEPTEEYEALAGPMLRLAREMTAHILEGALARVFKESGSS
jgi:hypothetical protein